VDLRDTMERTVMPGEILILTVDGDAHAEHVTRLLTGRGADVIQFNPGRFPAQASLSVTILPGDEPRRLLAAGERAIELDRLRAVWFRRPAEPEPHPEVTDPATRTYIRGECALFSLDVWDGLGCRLVPAQRGVTTWASCKLHQLIEARALGFISPPTLVTTDPEEFLDFYCAHDGNVITKVLEQLGAYQGDGDFGRFTDLVSTRDIGYAQSVRLCPVIVQAYCEKALELRVTVVGQQVFAAEIHSQQSNRARLDWRRYHMRATPHGVHRLPDAIAERCVALVGQLGLCYGAIDLILDPDGCYVFLEINPDGQYLWIEQATGLPISDALCDLLLGRELTVSSRTEHDDA
jgi:MvdD-like protein with pre-ATP grasp domain